jgi:hypothetical protein
MTTYTFRKDIPGWLHSNEVSAIVELCKKLPKNKNVLEIGPFAGRTTQLIAQLCKKAIIYSIDPWPIIEPPQVWEGMTDYDGPEFNTNDTQSIFLKEICEVYKNVIPIHGRFPLDFPYEYANKLGWIHWDTDSVSTVDDIRRELHAAWRLLPVGGIMSGHTFAWWQNNVVNAVREFGLDMDKNIILPPSGSIWYIVKDK